jgi:hypothetical protein
MDRHETLYRKKSIRKRELVEWLKMEDLNSNPSTTKK